MSAIRLCCILLLLLVQSCEQTADYWSAQELKTLASLQLSKLPKNLSDPSNQYSRSNEAAKFGEALFFDKRFSLDGSLACASCHQPDRAFTDGLAKAKGIHKTGRNTQTILGVAHANWFYWDGRKDSLWSQALIPFEASDEMASSRVKVLKIIGADSNYRNAYENLFGEFPSLVFDPSIPEQAGPWGDTKTRDNWYRIPPSSQLAINRAYGNIGKAIAAYEQTLPMPSARFDEFLSILLHSGEKSANALLSQDELAGIKLFLDENKTHCMRCHNGPLFTNNDFHNIGTGNFTGSSLDFGRYLGIQAVIQDEFNCLGAYSDAKPEQCLALRFLPKQIHNEMQGAFKTPGLRYLKKTAPYFHDGRFKSLEMVMQHYMSASGKENELPKLDLTAQEQTQLIAFLLLLSDGEISKNNDDI